MGHKEKFEVFLDKMQGLLDSAKKQGHINVRVEDLENTLTEFKEEYEDERIREEIISIVKSYRESCITEGNHRFDDCISWLEKQSKEDSSIQQAYEQGYTEGKRIERKRWIEKQDEQKQKQKQYDIDILEKYITKDSISELAHTVIVRNGWEIVDAKEQKLADTINPKFKDGDWIVYRNSAWQICNIGLKTYYELLKTNNEVSTRSIEEVDANSHLWTIADAKPGDVLVSQYNQPFIYNGNYNDYKVGAYCGIEYTGEQFTDAYAKMCWTDNKFINPATKEQSDTLFAKMKEAGYEWDSEKKEVKKIHVIDEGKAEMDYCFTKMMNGEKVSPSEEDEEYNGEDYGIDSLYHAQRILEKTLGKVDGYQSDDGILEHKCAITAVKKLYKQKPGEWSEEDNKWIEGLIQTFEDGYLEGFNQLQSYGVIDWLKSIKERYTWKPSLAQMNALSIVSKGNAPDDMEAIVSLYNDLKKLKGE